MKNRIDILILLILILIISISQNVVLCQHSNEDTIQTQIVELTQGCILVMDEEIDTTDSLINEIVNGIRNIMPRIQKLIPADSITIDLGISSENLIPGLGMTGATTSSHSVWINFDPKNPDFKVELLLCGLVHESHHMSRLRMPQWQLTLLECMIAEGLADNFMIEVNNCERSSWSQALTEEEIKQYMKKVKPVLFIIHESWTAEFNEKYFVPWMFGRTGDNPIPHWTGYSIGWKLVKNYLNDHPDATASSLVWTLAEIIASSTPELLIDNE